MTAKKRSVDMSQKLRAEVKELSGNSVAKRLAVVAIFSQLLGIAPAAFAQNGASAPDAKKSDAVPAAANEAKTESKDNSATDSKASDSKATEQASSTPETTREAAASPTKDSAAGQDAKAAASEEPQKLTPADKPKPPGFDAAVKLYSEKKWDAAQKAFEKYIKDGTDDVNTHAYLAFCLYKKMQYTRAKKEYEWVAENSTKDTTLRDSCKGMATRLNYAMTGTCPGTCIKRYDRRWYKKPDGSMWIRFSDRGGRGGSEWSHHHIGDQVKYSKDGRPYLAGKCPMCGGKGALPVLRDGMPPPT